MAFDRDQLKSMALIGAIVAICSAGLFLIWSVKEFSDNTKYALSGMLLLIYPAVMLVERLFKRTGDGDAAPTTQPARQPQMPRVFPELERDATVALGWLREHLGGSNAGDWLYSRPWFVVAGPPASGKTTLLQASDLYFQTLPGDENTAAQLSKPCAWRITDEAVLLDTAGYYQTDDREEWQGLLELLKKHRKQRPLDGLLLTVNGAQLASAEPPQIEAQAKTLRARLDDAIKSAGQSFPVYLIFTHADEIPGFAEFFHPAKPQEREQVWGVTFPLNQAAQAREKLEGEFDLLYHQLLRRRLPRLSVPTEAGEQLRCFAFPAAFRRTNIQLALFISVLFRPNPYSKQPLLRGFYFTASRTTSSGRRNADGSRATSPFSDAPGAAPPMGYFTKQLFRQIILGDRHLAASLQAGTNLRYLAQQALVVLVALLLTICTIGVFVSFVRNRELISEGQKLGQLVKTAYEKHQKDQFITTEELQALEGLREFLVGGETPNLFQRFGLYSGRAISEPLRASYFEVISQRFFRPAAIVVEQDLNKFAKAPASVCRTSEGGSLSDEGAKCYGRNYKLLRAYRMFLPSEPVNPGLLTEAFEPYWRKLAPAAETTTILNQLSYYARLAASPDAPHWKIDSQMAKEMETALLKDYPMPNRYLDVITAQADQQLMLEQEAFASVLRSTWVTSNAPAVPGSYTLKGYKRLHSELEQISPDVVKAEGLSTSIAPSSVQTLYAAEYTRQWERFLSGIKVSPFPKDNSQLRVAFEELAKTESAITRSLKKVAEQTGQVTPQPIGWWDKIFGATPAKPPKEVIEKFRPLKAFVAEDENSGLNKYLKALQPLQSKLDEIIKSGEAPTIKELKQILALAETNVQQIVEPLKQGATQPAANLLEQPLSNLRAFLEGDEITRLKAEWQNLDTAVRKMATQYPFNRNSPSDASPTEVKKTFNPIDGDLANLVKGLEKYIERNPATRQWQSKQQGQPFPSQQAIEYLNRVAKMQDALFQGSELKVSYTMTVKTLPVGCVIKINNQELSQNLGLSTTWPPSNVSGITVTQNGTTVSVPEASGDWGIFKLVYKSGNRSFISAQQVQITISGISGNGDPFDRQLFDQLGKVPPLQ